MGLYDAFKDAISVAQKADNIELYKQLLDLSAQALDLQEENTRLKAENAELRKNKDMESSITRHQNPYLTLSEDAQQIKYCAICWDSEHKLVQMNNISGNYSDSNDLSCHKCKNRCKLDMK